MNNKSTTDATSSACQKCDDNLLKLEKVKKNCHRNLRQPSFYFFLSSQLEISCLQLQNTNADHLTELNRLKQELANARREAEHLEEKLNLKELRDQEIEKLKKKAEEFEEYMRANTRSGSVASSLTNVSTKTNVSTETSDLGEETSQRTQQLETKIRDEMAKVFAFEVKSIEKNFRNDVEKFQHQIIQISQELHENSSQLNVRNEQLQLLKFTIIEERSVFEESLKQKDDDFKVAIDKYRTEHETNQQRVEELMEQLNENKELIAEERLSIENLKRQINEERASLAKREQEVMNNYKNLEKRSEKLLKDSNEKLLSAKRTAANYKQYSEDKENHFRKELERTKAACIAKVEMSEVKLRESLMEKDKNYQERVKKIETEFEFKVEILKGMLKKT